MASRMGGAPIMVMNQQVQRETGRKAQLSNIAAGKAVSDIVRTTMGPRSMLKMLLDPMGGIVMTNDGNSILREVDVSHPAAKSMIELSRAQDARRRAETEAQRTATQNEELRARLSAMAVSVGDLEAEAASLKATVASIAAEDGR